MVLAQRRNGQTFVVTGNPSGDGLPSSPSGGAAPRPLTWGDRTLRRRVRVVRVEPCLQTRPMPGASEGIDGELYTKRCTRGNLRAKVLRGGTFRCKTGETYLLHPFTGASKGAGAGNGLPMRTYLPKIRGGQGPEAPATEVTVRTPEEVAS